MVAIILISIFIIYFLYSPSVREDMEPVEIAVEEGDGLGKITQKLHDSGLIRSSLLFTLYIKIRGEENELKAGNYVLYKSLNIPTITRLIVTGKSKPDDIKVFIPEGSNIWEIDEKLVQAGLISEGEFSSQYHDIEGYLFPDTYHISQNSKVKSQNLLEELGNKMAENFNNKTASLLGGLSLAESREVIVIASILEKEARTEQDMKLVSGIIKKRLELGIPLQIDAAVIYGACRRIAEEGNWIRNCNVTFQGPAIEIKIEGPFNTYI